MRETFLVVVECAIQHQDKFLIIQRPLGAYAGGLLAFPGGKVEYSDPVENVLLEAIKREVKEEVGLTLLDPIEHVTSTTFTTTSQETVLDIVFHTQLEKTAVTVTPCPREVPVHYWLSVEEILTHEQSPRWLKNSIQLIQKRL